MSNPTPEMLGSLYGRTAAYNVVTRRRHVALSCDVCAQKLLYGCVLPMMSEQLDHVDTMEFVLPSFLALIKRVSVAEYQQHIKTQFKRVFRTARSVQVKPKSIFLRNHSYLPFVQYSTCLQTNTGNRSSSSSTEGLCWSLELSVDTSNIHSNNGILAYNHWLTVLFDLIQRCY